MNTAWLIPVIAYFLGSIPFGYLIVKLTRGADVRTSGSGNIGATNVGRVAGRTAGIVTLALDAGKGYLAVWLASRWAHGSVRWMMAAALAAVLGHLFSCWLRFRGGKGVATAMGVFLPISREAVGAALVIWIVVVAFWKYASLGSIIAAATFPILIYLLYSPGHAPTFAVSLGSTLIAVLVILKHRENIGRLLAGTESRLTKNK
jgi:acyl phosphate:glycerol-3-phosphate acyltransferase